MFLPERLGVLYCWIKERESIRIKREVQGKPKPWTDDLLLRSTRFCNVRRMDDKVSRWLLQNFYVAVPPDEAVVAAAMARLINWPETLSEVYPDGWTGWNRNEVLRCLLQRAKNKKKVFTGVYIINAANASEKDRAQGNTKIRVVVRTVEAVHAARKELVNTDSMQQTHKNLQSVPGIGSFIAGQIVADLRHIMKGGWLDRMVWAPRGPGSQRGMRWLMDREGSLSEEDFDNGIIELMDLVRQNLPYIFKDRRLEAHDIQNCLCELSKYVRLAAGGRGKNKYPGGV
jgi:hypothetical protein